MSYKIVIFLAFFIVALVLGLMQAQKEGFRSDTSDDSSWMIDDGASFDDK